MTTQELKQYIDKVLGNNLRCLLPSYWWKRLFSLTLDKVDEKLDAANIKTINGESILGEGNIVVNVDTSNLATREELNAKQDVIEDLETIRSGAAKGATALQEHQDISHLASKEELQNLQNEVIANEEVVAAAFNDVNDRINAISENVSGTTVTKEELESTVEIINQTISDNKSATDTAIEGLETSIGNVDAKFANYATTESLTTEITNLTNEIIANEEVHAAALNDLNERLNNGGGSSSGGALRVWLDEIINGEVSAERKEENAQAFNSIKNGVLDVMCVAELNDNIGVVYYEIYRSVNIAISDNAVGVGIQMEEDGTPSYYTINIVSDGSVAIGA